MAFNSSGDKIATLGSSPDYMLAVWDWEEELIVLRSKAFGQDVFRVSFSPTNDGILTTSGLGHIRFWKMAQTFTGLFGHLPCFVPYPWRCVVHKRRASE